MRLPDILIMTLMLLAASLPADDRRPLVYAHLMPWYASEEVSGYWGWHWTMNHFNPGDRENPTLAANDPPLLGPYDSTDRHLQECHAALLKLGGIDGVIFDWYGISDFRDYAFIHRSTLGYIEVLEEAGLGFAVCYEDQSVKHRTEEQGLSPGESLQAGVADMIWLKEHAFNQPHYLRLEGRPVLMVFGPQFFEADEWETLRDAVAPDSAWIFGLPHLAMETGMDGAMGWPPVSGGVEISREEYLTYLQRLEDNAGGSPFIASAFPAFEDIYEQAGVHPSYGSIDPRGGDTLRETLQIALASGAPIVQIATWNDFGEGTVIEPAVDDGYSRLEIVQDMLTAGEPANLRLPIDLYQLRKQFPEEREIQQELDRLSQLLLQGETAGVREALDALALPNQPVESEVMVID